jgi:polysaccharide export outer membrane protein
MTLYMRGAGLVVCAGLLVASQAVSQTPGGSASAQPNAAALASSASATEGFAQRNPRYHVQPNDVLEVQFRLTPEFNFTATVQPDGYISSQIIGDVHVGGMTTSEISQAVAQKASTRLKDPEVGVALKDFVKPHFVVAGEVAKPGSYELRGDMGLIQGIAMSGGFVNSSAKRTQVILVRRMNSEYAEVKVFDMRKLMSPGGVREDVTLRPDDILIVPQNAMSKIEPYLRLSSMGIWGLTMGIP